MRVNFNIGSFKIIYVHMEEHIKQALSSLRVARAALEQGKTNSDYAYVEHLSKVQKSAKMIGLDGVSLVLEVVQDLANEMTVERIVGDDAVRAVVVIEKAVNLMSFYLNGLSTGSFDEPLRFYAVYSEMSDILDRKSSPYDLFFSRSDVISAKDLEDFIASRQVSGSLREMDIDKAKGLLSISGGSLNISPVREMLCSWVSENIGVDKGIKVSDKVSLFWAIFLAFDKVVVPNVVTGDLALAVDVLSGAVDFVSALGGTENKKTIKPPADVFNKMVYLLATYMKSDRTFADEIDKFFNISFYIDQVDLIDTVQEVSVLSEAGVEDLGIILAGIKDGYELFCSKDKSEDFYASIVSKMADDIRDVLRLAPKSSFGIHDLAQALMSNLNKISHNEALRTDSVFESISSALVSFEDAVSLAKVGFLSRSDEKQAADNIKGVISNMSSVLGGGKGARDGVAGFARLRAVESQKTSAVLFEQVSGELAIIEETLDLFIRDDDDLRPDFSIEDISGKLSLVSGILDATSFSPMVKIISDIKEVLGLVAKFGVSGVDKDALDNSVRWLSALALFASDMAQGNHQAAMNISKTLIEDYNETTRSELPFEFKSAFSQEYESNPSYTNAEENVALPVSQSKESNPQEATDNVDDLFNSADPDVQDRNPAEEAEALEDKYAQTGALKDEPNDQELVEVFLEEMEGVQESLASSFDVLSKNIEDADEWMNVKRSFHTLKGSGKMVGLMSVGEVALAVEMFIANFLNYKKPATKDMLDAVRAVASKFEDWAGELRENNFIILDPNIEVAAFHKGVATSNDEQPVGSEINEEPQSQVEIASASEAQEQENAVESDYVMMNGKEVGKDLFELFKEERQQYLQVLESWATEGDNKIDDQMVRAAHTLSSIYATVGLNKFSDFASKLENLFDAIKVAGRPLNNIEMSLLVGAISNIQEFANIEESEIDNDNMTNAMDDIVMLRENFTRPSSVPSYKNESAGSRGEEVYIVEKPTSVADRQETRERDAPVRMGDSEALSAALTNIQEAINKIAMRCEDVTNKTENIMKILSGLEDKISRVSPDNNLSEVVPKKIEELVVYVREECESLRRDIGGVLKVASKAEPESNGEQGESIEILREIKSFNEKALETYKAGIGVMRKDIKSVSAKIELITSGGLVNKIKSIFGRK